MTACNISTIKSNVSNLWKKRRAKQSPAYTETSNLTGHRKSRLSPAKKPFENEEKARWQ
jgi:hypothetical protein